MCAACRGSHVDGRCLAASWAKPVILTGPLGVNSPTLDEPQIFVSVEEQIGGYNHEFSWQRKNRQRCARNYKLSKKSRTQNFPPATANSQFTDFVAWDRKMKPLRWSVARFAARSSPRNPCPW